MFAEKEEQSILIDKQKEISIMMLPKELDKLKYYSIILNLKI